MCGLKLTRARECITAACELAVYGLKRACRLSLALKGRLRIEGRFRLDCGRASCDNGSGVGSPTINGAPNGSRSSLTR